MKKFSSLAGGLFLLAVSVFAACAGSVLKAEAKEVAVRKGKELFYEGHHTFYYYIDGELGYCLEPRKSSPDDGFFSAALLDDGSLLSKTLYYVYGGPGYERCMKAVFPQEWREPEKSYCLSHCILAYVYDDCSGSRDAFFRLGSDMQELVVACTNAIRGFPDVPEPDIAFQEKELTEFFTADQKIQRTSEVTCTGDPENSVELALPEYVTLVNTTKGTQTRGKSVVWGQDRFYLTADVKDYNGGTWSSGNLYGRNRQSWRSFVVSTGESWQHLGTGRLIEAEITPASLKVVWIPKPKLEVAKRADKSGKRFRLGDLITYSIDVTQQIKDAVAKNVVITDTILTEGVKLQKNSIVLLDQDQSIVSDAVISVKGNSYTIQAGEFLQSIEAGEKYTVEYQVAITDESVIGKEIRNEVVVRADNCEEEKDDETVTVEEPEEPEGPEPRIREEEPEEPGEPEEPEIPVKEEIEEPETDIQKIPEISEKKSPVKTGDRENLMVLMLLAILSCTVIFICGRIARKTK